MARPLLVADQKLRVNWCSRVDAVSLSLPCRCEVPLRDLLLSQVLDPDLLQVLHLALSSFRMPFYKIKLGVLINLFPNLHSNSHFWFGGTRQRPGVPLQAKKMAPIDCGPKQGQGPAGRTGIAGEGCLPPGPGEGVGRNLPIWVWEVQNTQTNTQFTGPRGHDAVTKLIEAPILLIALKNSFSGCFPVLEADSLATRHTSSILLWPGRLPLGQVERGCPGN
jgi:hypothetical protein